MLHRGFMFFVCFGLGFLIEKGVVGRVRSVIYSFLSRKMLFMVILGISSPISRHQLFVHEDIPFTSHNSSMCFGLTLEDEAIEPIIGYMADFLEIRSEKGSDPDCVWQNWTAVLPKKSLLPSGKWPNRP